MDGIEYARSGEGFVAYRTLGDGPVDLLCCNEITMVSIDSIPDEPHWSNFEHRLASFARVICYDRSGIGLSDSPPPGTPLTVDTWAQDALAVLDATGSSRAALLGFCGGGTALSLWVDAPERVSHLILFNAAAHLDRGSVGAWLNDYGQWLDEVTRPDRPEAALDDVAVLMPTLSHDARFRSWWRQAGQRGASPKMAAAQNQAMLDVDLRSVLPTIGIPTLVLCRADAALGAAVHSRHLAGGIPGARFVELDGSDFFPFAGDADAVVEEIEEFLTGGRSARPVHRVLTTILFSDIVSSTTLAAALGDAEWRARLDAHDAMMRHQFERFGGHEVKTTGDGFLATFDSPARAIQCGRSACDEARGLGIEIRVGIHTGEVEQRDSDVGGIAVHIGARIAAAAAPGAVLVSSTVKDLVAGSGLRFEDRGTRELKGVPDVWHLFEVAG